MSNVLPRLDRPYRIGLNAHLLSLARSYRGAGINGYILQLLLHLPLLPDEGAELNYTAFLHEGPFEGPPGLHVQKSVWDTSGPGRRIVWEQTRLAALSHRFDLLHGLAFAVPLAANCPTIVTVHDLSFLRYPDAFRRFNRSYLSFITRLSTRRAERIIAVSESTRQDVISLCGISPERVIKVPNGVTGDFRPARPTEVAEFRRRAGLPDRYILYLGTLEPRKNVVRLVEAYHQLRGSMAGDVNSRVPDLVIAGGKGWFYQEIFARVQALGLSANVHFPGFVPSEELPWWYRGAELFIYPSLYEGFGLPVLEAMACGTPTVTSALSSLPEVAGDAALLVHPEDTGALAHAMDRLLTDQSLAERLREMGPRQAACFSWQRTAAQTARVYLEVLESSPCGGQG